MIIKINGSNYIIHENVELDLYIEEQNAANILEERTNYIEQNSI